MDQFSKHVTSLVAQAQAIPRQITPKPESPPAFESPIDKRFPFSTLPSSNPEVIEPSSQKPSLTLEPTRTRSEANDLPAMDPGVIKSGKVVVFDMDANVFSYRTIKPGQKLAAIMTSQHQHVSLLPIEMFQNKVVVSEASVLGVKMVGDVVKTLPTKVVLLRLLGWYKELLVLRERSKAFGNSTNGEEYVYNSGGFFRTKKELEGGLKENSDGEGFVEVRRRRKSMSV